MVSMVKNLAAVAAGGFRAHNVATPATICSSSLLATTARRHEEKSLSASCVPDAMHTCMSSEASSFHLSPLETMYFSESCGMSNAQRATLLRSQEIGQVPFCAEAHSAVIWRSTTVSTIFKVSGCSRCNCSLDLFWVFYLSSFKILKTQFKTIRKQQTTWPSNPL